MPSFAPSDEESKIKISVEVKMATVTCISF